MGWIASKITHGLHTLGGTRNYAFSAAYGESVRAGWSVDNDVLTITADPLGLAPLYYFESGNTLICADSISELFRQGVPARLDPLLLAMNVCLSFCPLDLTIFEGIKRVAPGATITRIAGKEGSIHSSRLAVPPKLDMDRTTAVEAFGEYFEAGLANLTRGEDRISVPVSGGRDSRHILLASKKLGKIVETITFTNFPPGDQDVEVADELSRRTGCRHTVIKNSEYRYHKSLSSILPHVNFETVQHGWIWSLAAALKRAGRPFCDGLAGGTLSNNVFFSFERNRMLKDGLIDEAAGEMSSALLAKLPGRDGFREADIDRLHWLVKAELNRWLDWPNPYRAYIFFNRTRRSVSASTFAVSRLSGVPVYFPYVEERPFNLLMGMDDQLTKSEIGFHDEAIIRRYPEYADLPFGKRLQAGRLGYVSSFRNVLPYLRSAAVPHASELYGRQRLIGILKILFGSDFADETWRFVGSDLAQGIVLALQGSGQAHASLAEAPFD